MSLLAQRPGGPPNAAQGRVTRPTSLGEEAQNHESHRWLWAPAGPEGTATALAGTRPSPLESTKYRANAGDWQMPARAPGGAALRAYMVTTRETRTVIWLKH